MGFDMVLKGFRMILMGLYIMLVGFYMMLNAGIYMTANVRICMTTNVRIYMIPNVRSGLRMCGRIFRMSSFPIFHDSPEVLLPPVFQMCRFS